MSDGDDVRAGDVFTSARGCGFSGGTAACFGRSSWRPFVLEEGEMDTKQGFLVLADISGFTALVTATELEHGPAIIADLLEAGIPRISPPLEIEGIGGEAG